MKKPLTTTLKTLMVAMSVALTACATTNLSSSPQAAQQVEAKSTLETALSSQLRSSFSYRTDVYISNAKRRQYLENADIQPPVYDEYERCERTHDDEYVALLKQAYNESLDVNDAKYEGARNQIMQTYKDCLKEQANREKSSTYVPFDFDSFYQNYKDADSETQASAFMSEIEAHITSQQEVSAEPEKRYTALDVKKAQLLSAYALEPTHVSVVGSYEPLKGKFTALPTLEYRAPNISLAVRQPLYMDIKSGGVYLWADNFAYANSQVFDKRLGDKWQNKWLYVPLNDGSLPEGFAKDLVRAYIDAKKQSFLSLPKSGFAVVNAGDVASLPFVADNLPADKMALINNTPLIIRDNNDSSAQAYRDYVFYDTLYQEMTKKYPMLTVEPDYSFYERQIRDGESAVDVVNAESATPTTTDEKRKLNSKFLMQVLFNYYGRKVGEYYSDLAAGQYQQNATETATKQTLIDAAATTSETQDAEAPIWYYGINQGKISWVHGRYHTVPSKKVAAATEESMLLTDVFTQIFPSAQAVDEFSRLPADVRTPNASNSVNVFEYKDELLKRLESSDDDISMVLRYLLMLEQSDSEGAEAVPACGARAHANDAVEAAANVDGRSSAGC